MEDISHLKAISVTCNNKQWIMKKNK